MGSIVVITRILHTAVLCYDLDQHDQYKGWAVRVLRYVMFADAKLLIWIDVDQMV